MKKQNFFLTIAGMFIFTSQAFGWGAKGHQIVAYVGADLATQGQEFWQSNLEPMRQLSTVPDRVWKAASTYEGEKANHWFQADGYNGGDISQATILSFPHAYSDAVSQFTSALVLTNGTAPWRVRQFYQSAIDALKAGNTTLALQLAGVMSHYVGDMSQPLHDSANYDGADTNQKGIHKYFETDNIQNEMAIRAVVMTRAQALLKDPSFMAQFNGSLMDTILYEVYRSVAHRDEVLSNDKQYGRSGQGASIQLDLAEDRMADGAATLSVILSKMYQEAGVSMNATPTTVADPAWISPDFTNQTSTNIHWSAPFTALHEDPMADDCNEI